MFQFHIGAIRSHRSFPRKEHQYTCFNSILVQLEDVFPFVPDGSVHSFNSILVQLEGRRSNRAPSRLPSFNSILVQLEATAFA